MEPPTIHELKKQGYKVQVRHMRYPTLDGFNLAVDEGSPPLPYSREKGFVSRETNLGPSCRGGKTEVRVTPPGSNVVLYGEAKCSIMDNFNRKLGTRIALGRALAALHYVGKEPELLKTY